MSSHIVSNGISTSVLQPALLPLRTVSYRGVWCCFLIPVALFSSLDQLDSDLEHTCFILSCFLCVASLINAYYFVYSATEEGPVRYLIGSVVSDLFERRKSVEARVTRKVSLQCHPPQPPKEPQFSRSRYLLILGSALVATVWFARCFYLPVVIVALTCLTFYFLFLPTIFQTFPLSFTFGEGCVALQGLILFTLKASVSLWQRSVNKATSQFADKCDIKNPFLCRDDDAATESGSFTLAAKTGLLSCLVFCSLPLVPGFAWLSRSVAFFPAGVAFLLGITYPYLWHRLHR